MPKNGKNRVLDTEIAVLQTLTRKTDLTTRDPFGPFEAVENRFLRVLIVYSTRQCLRAPRDAPCPPFYIRYWQSGLATVHAEQPFKGAYGIISTSPKLRKGRRKR